MRARWIGQMLIGVLVILGGSSREAIAQAGGQWIASWASAQMPVREPANLPAHGFADATLRETVHLSLGGERIRLRISNVFGDQPLVLRAVTVARAQLNQMAGASGDPWPLVAGTSRPVSFGGATAITVPAGAEYLSDPVELRVEAFSDLSVNMTIEAAPRVVTSHPGARTTCFLQAGGIEERFPHWFFLSAVEVKDDGRTSDVAILGDSITDGHGATDDANNRWTDVLARRLALQHVGVLNLGIGGNRILQDGLGPSALARLPRDVLSQPRVRVLVILEGINDIGSFGRVEKHSPAEHDALVAALEEALRQMAVAAHERGIRVIGGTLTPFAGSSYYHPTAQTENDRQRLNRWIRSSADLDGVIDFDALLRDPLDPEKLSKQLDSGDGLHPGPEGYRRMGEDVPLELLLR